MKRPDNRATLILQNMQGKIFFIGLIIALTYPPSALGQTISEDEQGQIIISYPDGSWRYLNENQPEDQRLIENWEAEQQRHIIVQKVRRLIAAAEVKQEEAVLQLALLKERRQEAFQEQDGEVDIAFVQSLTSSIEQQEKTLANREEVLDQRRKWEPIAEGLSHSSTPQEDEKWLSKLEKAGFPLDGSADADDPTANSTFDYPRNLEDIEVEPYDPLLSTQDFPPTPPCAVETGQRDELTGLQPLQHRPEVLFRYTSPKLLSVMKEKDFIVGNAALLKLGKDQYTLELEVLIRSQYAQKEFGMLERGSKMILVMLSGYQVALENKATSTGLLNPVEKTVLYQCRYSLSKSDLKALEVGTLDFVRLIWSTGYDDYPVYDLDLLKRQLLCLKNAKQP